MTAGQFVNVDQEQAWDRGEGVHWSENADRYDATMARHGERLLAAAAIETGDRVLDIGCGSGASTLDAARAATGGGSLGVDLSGPMLEQARARARAADLANAEFQRADAQVCRFTEAYDVVISRFGAMFFADPVAAFTNIGGAIRPDGRLALMAWQPLDRNEWLLALRAALAMGRELPSPPVGAPGPFGLADPDAVRQLLGESRFDDIALDEVAEPMFIGTDAEDAFGFVGGFGPVRGMLADLDEADRARALDQLHAALIAHETADGVLFDSHAWLITARRPA